MLGVRTSTHFVGETQFSSHTPPSFGGSPHGHGSDPPDLGGVEGADAKMKWTKQD